MLGVSEKHAKCMPNACILAVKARYQLKQLHAYYIYTSNRVHTLLLTLALDISTFFFWAGFGVQLG